MKHLKKSTTTSHLLKVELRIKSPSAKLMNGSPLQFKCLVSQNKLQRISHFPIWKVWVTLFFRNAEQIERSFHFVALMFECNKKCLTEDESLRSCLTLKLCPDLFDVLFCSYYSAESILCDITHITLRLSRCLEYIYF